MGFCAILGGTVTLVGSSPLILLNDLVRSANDYLPAGVPKMEEFGLFDVTPIGLVMIAVGILYFVYLGKLVLPVRSAAPPKSQSTMAYLMQTYHVAGELFEIAVGPGSPLEGRTMQYIREKSGFRVNVVGLRRDGKLRLAPPSDTEYRPGDVLALMAGSEDMAEFAESCNLTVRPDLLDCAEALSPTISGVAEVVIAPRSSLIGKTTSEVRFRQKYNAAVLAVYRGDQVITDHISNSPLQAGDALLIHCRWENLALLDKDSDFIVITDYPQQDLEMRTDKVKYALLFFAVSIGLVLFTDLRLSVAFMTGAIGMILTGVLRVDEAYQSIDWRTVFLLAGLIPLGIAVDQSGTAAWIAHHVVNWVGGAPSWVILLAVAILATLFSLVMSNVGATVLLVPLAVNIAIGSGGDPRIFALVVGVATSNSFILPTHQVNALIMGAAGYRNKDFLRAGGIMSVVFLVVLMVMLTLFY
jgi:di/tricarboxylate transporter